MEERAAISPQVSPELESVEHKLGYVKGHTCRAGRREAGRGWQSSRRERYLWYIWPKESRITSSQVTISQP